MVYPFTNVLWIIVTFILSYQLARWGVGLHKTTALLGVALMFLGTNVVGMALRIPGYSEQWERYFGDMRYSPFLSKFYAFDTMLWGMALLIAMALVYTIALRSRVTALGSLTTALLIGLGLVYPVLFPAGLVFAGCFTLLAMARLTKDLPQYTRCEIAKLGFAILLSVIIVSLYLAMAAANRDATIFTLSSWREIRLKAIRFLGALGPFIVLAALPFIGFIRRRNGPALLLGLSAAAFSAIYVGIDLTQLEYKYVLAATIGLAFLAAAVLDTLFQQRQLLGSGTLTLVVVGLTAINLLFVFRAGGHIPGNLDQGARLDETAFWISLSPSEPDSAWTTAIRERTPENTIVIARRPAVQLSALVGRSMYIPSDTEGGFIPGYNLDQRFYLVEQRGYSADVYNRRLEVVEILYTSEDDDAIIQALHSLKELERPVAIYFPRRDLYLLRWLKVYGMGKDLVPDGQKTVWFVNDYSTLP
jgi:hypothetical protein